MTKRIILAAALLGAFAAAPAGAAQERVFALVICGEAKGGGLAVKAFDSPHVEDIEEINVGESCTAAAEKIADAAEKAFLNGCIQTPVPLPNAKGRSDILIMFKEEADGGA